MSDNNTQGFGLAILSLALLAGAFIVTFYLDNAILGSILAFVAAILAFASFFEARRAGGPARLSLTIIIITMLGAIFSLIRTISVTQQAEESIIIQAPEAPSEPNVNSEKKMKELEEKIEELEEDSIN